VGDTRGVARGFALDCPLIKNVKKTTLSSVFKKAGGRDRAVGGVIGGVLTRRVAWEDGSAQRTHDAPELCRLLMRNVKKKKGARRLK